MVESIGSGCYGGGGLSTWMTVVDVLSTWYAFSLPVFMLKQKFLKTCLVWQVSSGKADVKRLCISGGSAGGYTTLAALAFRDVFKAGASLYRVITLYYNTVTRILHSSLQIHGDWCLKTL